MVTALLIGVPTMAALADTGGADTTTQAPGPTLTTDQPDYAPGAVVRLFGAGWAPDEAVHVDVNDEAGQTWSLASDVQADDSGHIVTQFQLPDWFVATYLVTANGASGDTATVTFTDTQPPNSSVTFPVEAAYYNVDGFNAGCGTVAGDICGTATGGKGAGQNPDLNLTGVTVAIAQDNGANRRYWDGHAFASTSEVDLAATTTALPAHTATWSYQIDGSVFAEGHAYLVISRAADTLNTEASSDKAHFRFDLTDPTIDITSPSNGASLATASTTVSGTVSDAGGSGLKSVNVNGVDAVLDLAAGTFSATDVPLSCGDAGSNPLTATATDNAGNTAQDQVTVTRTCDTEAPDITFSVKKHATSDDAVAATTGWYNIGSSGVGGIDLTVTATDLSRVTNLTCTDSINGAVASTVIDQSPALAVSPLSNDPVVVLGDGVNDLSCTATDTLGNTSGEPVTTVYMVDQTAPTVTHAIGSPNHVSGSDTFVTSATDLTVTVADEATGSGVDQCTIVVSGKYPACVAGDNSFTLDSLLFGTAPPDGPYTTTGDATDVAGNAATEDSFPVILDNTAPMTTDNAPSGWTNASSVVVTLTPHDGSGSGVAHTYYNVDAQSPSEGTSAAVSGDGDHTVIYWSDDNLGNTEESHTVHVKIDTTPPTVTCVPATFLPNALHQRVSADVSDGLSGPLDAIVHSGDVNTSVLGGPFLASVTGFDMAGNYTTKSCSYYVGIPVPEVIGLSSGANSVSISANTTAVDGTGGALTGTVASNGTVTLSGAMVDGAVTTPNGEGGVVKQKNGRAAAYATGGVALATDDQTFKACGSTFTFTPSLPKGPYTYDATKGDLTVSGGNQIALAGGQYCFHNVTLSGGSKLVVPSGTTTPVRVTMTGQFNGSGGSLLNMTNDPVKLQISTKFTGNNAVVLSGGSQAFALVFAPTGQVVLSGGSPLTGAILGNTVVMSGNSLVHCVIPVPADWQAHFA